MNIKALNGLIPTGAQVATFEEWHIDNVIKPLFRGYEGSDIVWAYEATAPLAETHDGLVEAMKMWLGVNVEIDDADNGVVRGVHYGGMD